MYWNAFLASCAINCNRLIETWDVLKSGRTLALALALAEAGLIETWDVLKFGILCKFRFYRFGINRNMRCIEIVISPTMPSTASPINRNMRCIEILLPPSPLQSLLRLIETWDVLKFVRVCRFSALFSINRNMRCIEMNGLW